ncbi:MAG: hypothetical protein O2956_02380 [Gemmatimonadetes bacterium]|nr:hypothetical protein [Gemmatimonadota bacterium]
MTTALWVGRRRAVLWTAVWLVLAGCEAAPRSAAPLNAQESISRETFVAWVERISEPSGYFDTDNLISNESGYLNVIDALHDRRLQGGAYVGVGPDQNFSYVAELRPEIVFITDVRRDNLLHHLLLKSLIERAPSRVEFLAGLHGVRPPTDAEEWHGSDIDEIVAYIDTGWSDGAEQDAGLRAALHAEIAESIRAFGLSLSDADFATIRRFHQTFMDAGPSLRFTTFGRAPQPYYPTYRQLALETDLDGDQASYLATRERYEVVRELQLANRVIPVVGDLSGRHAMQEMGSVMREMGVAVTAFYASNVEFYLWQAGTFARWGENLSSLPLSPDAVVIRSIFTNSGRSHPSAVRGYYATQALQPAATLTRGGFESYWDVVTRDVLPLR